MSSYRFVALLACWVSIVPPSLVAQQTQQPIAPPGERSGGLRILVLEGQNAINSVATKSAISPVVQVLDSMEQPVEGAEVTFEAPAAGPGGHFNGQPVVTVKTDYRGQATANFSPNDTPGSFSIRIKAAMTGQTAEVRVRQTNERRAMEATIAPPPKPWYKDWKWWAVIGGGAGAGAGFGIYLYNRDQTANITIAPGTGSIGGPR
ncbi:MAG: hypothetical protein IT161_24350 [Bryobacterales bacterium]|nr:hypothetical protein [Bryobacterales bacterium]